MADATRVPRLIIPGLAGFYAWIEPYCYPLMRFIIGACVVPIGWPKLMGGYDGAVVTMTKVGIPVPSVAAAFIVAIESIGGICIAVGFLTRLWAAALAIEMAVICFIIMMPRGYSTGVYTLLWGLLAFVVALRGSGRCSVDRLIGWEL